jgi:predicted enzyme related to lactoylglutathione lyase
MTLADAPVISLMVSVNDLASSREFYEGQLRLRAIESDADTLTLDGGKVRVHLRRASDHGIMLPVPPDKSANITLLVEDADAARAEIEQRGVTFTETFRYQVGAIHDLYDPDGHWLSIYEPSEESLTWPSGAMIRAVRASACLSEQGAHGVRASDQPTSGKGSSPSSKVIYVFMFVGDPDVAYNFYGGALGLRSLESRPCRRGSTPHGRGVVKYDVGNLVLTTHHVHACRSGSDAEDHSSEETDLDPVTAKGIAPVFLVSDLDSVVDDLSRRGVRFTGSPERSELGRTAPFEDPFGHLLYLYEPAAVPHEAVLDATRPPLVRVHP